MKLLISILIVVFMTGCATTKTTQDVFIPVAKKCYDESKVKKPVKPQLCTDSATGDESIDDALNCATNDVNKLKKYSQDLEIMICD